MRSSNSSTLRSRSVNRSYSRRVGGNRRPAPLSRASVAAADARPLPHSGRQADALAAYHRARTMLDDHLGIDPGPELQALEGQILRHEVPRS